MKFMMYSAKQNGYKIVDLVEQSGFQLKAIIMFKNTPPCTRSIFLDHNKTKNDKTRNMCKSVFTVKCKIIAKT